jgi:hypothetical protein
VQIVAELPAHRGLKRAEEWSDPSVVAASYLQVVVDQAFDPIVDGQLQVTFAVVAVELHHPFVKVTGELDQVLKPSIDLRQLSS